MNLTGYYGTQQNVQGLVGYFISFSVDKRLIGIVTRDFIGAFVKLLLIAGTIELDGATS